jgi:hypothetical protein
MLSTRGTVVARFHTREQHASRDCRKHHRTPSSSDVRFILSSAGHRLSSALPSSLTACSTPILEKRRRSSPRRRTSLSAISSIGLATLGSSFPIGFPVLVAEMPHHRKQDKPTWANTQRYSPTSAYSSTSPPRKRLALRLAIRHFHHSYCMAVHWKFKGGDPQTVDCDAVAPSGE